MAYRQRAALECVGEGMKSATLRKVRAACVVGGVAILFLMVQVATGQETKETITVEGQERTYILHLPKGYDE